MLIRSPQTLGGTLVFGFVTLPWAPKRPWTMKDVALTLVVKRKIADNFIVITTCWTLVQGL